MIEDTTRKNMVVELVSLVGAISEGARLTASGLQRIREIEKEFQITPQDYEAHEADMLRRELCEIDAEIGGEHLT